MADYSGPGLELSVAKLFAGDDYIPTIQDYHDLVRQSNDPKIGKVAISAPYVACRLVGTQKYCTHGYCQRAEAEKNMAQGKIAYIQKRLEMLEQELVQEIEKQERWGELEKIKNGTIIKWDQVFSNGKKYSFTAIKAAGRWYTSGIFQRRAMTLDELVEAHLSKAVEGTVKRAKRWEEI